MPVTDQSMLWSRVDEIVASAPGTAALQHHRLDLLAAHQQRVSGRALGPELLAAERLAAMRGMAVPQVLRRIRAAVDHPLVLMKGPEAAASYAVPACRPFVDLDILTSDAAAAYDALLAAGFTDIGKPDAGHHRPGLVWPGLPLTIELHSAPHYLPGLPIPHTDELLRRTRPSRTEIAGVEGLAPSAHAVLLAVHAWVHGPLEKLGPLIDVAAVLDDADRTEANALARRWGCQRLWRATTDAIESLLNPSDASIPMRTWARHLRVCREPRVVELLVARTAAPAWALPYRNVVRGVGGGLVTAMRPYEWESWSDQLLRSRRALRHTFSPLSEFRAQPPTEVAT